MKVLGVLKLPRRFVSLSEVLYEKNTYCSRYAK